MATRRIGWWFVLGAPMAAISLLGIVTKLGGDRLLFLELVHSIVIRWNYWTGLVFESFANLIPLELQYGEHARNFIVIMGAFFLPAFHALLHWDDGDEEGTFSVMARIALYAAFSASVIYIGMVSAPDYGGIVVNQVLVGLLAISLAIGLALPKTRTRTLVMLGIAAFVVTLEVIRFSPLNDLMASAQDWLEDVPTEYRE